LEIVIVLAPLRKHGPNPSYTEDRTLSELAVEELGLGDGGLIDRPAEAVGIEIGLEKARHLGLRTAGSNWSRVRQGSATTKRKSEPRQQTGEFSVARVRSLPNPTEGIGKQSVDQCDARCLPGIIRAGSHLDDGMGVRVQITGVLQVMKSNLPLRKATTVVRIRLDRAGKFSHERRVSDLLCNWDLVHAS
jgi:hypothetical protein